MSDENEEIFKEVFGDGDVPAGLREQLGASGLAIMIVGGGGLGGMPITPGEEVDYHDGSQILVPRNMGLHGAHKIFTRLVKEQETPTRFDRKFRYRADDGAHATFRVLQERYSLVLGEEIQTPFGPEPAETRTIAIGPNETMQVPWGRVSVPQLEGVDIRLCDRHPDPEYGEVFELHVVAPKKFQEEIQSIFEAVDQYLKEHSIYRGKALRGAHQLQFLDLGDFDPSQVILAEDVERNLNGTVWSTIRYTEALREDGVPRKMAALLHGPYGTGKTSVGQRTALIATENGWTFLSAGTDDDIEDVLQTARLYMPAVVLVEDIDTQASSGEDDESSLLLDVFDGITAKGGELVMILTTNHFERIHKGMLRPGRLDIVVEINSLDRSSVERLIRVVVNPAKLDDAVDYDAVYTAMEGFYPAFVRGAIDRARRFAIARLEGQSNYMLTTEDLVAAATALRPQLDALNAASEGERAPLLEKLLTGVSTTGAQRAVHGTQVQGLYEVELSVPALNGNSSH